MWIDLEILVGFRCYNKILSLESIEHWIVKVHIQM